MARNNDRDESLTNRLMSRADPGLRRRQMPDGGEVYSGPTARRALRAVGARAMTMDASIIVDDQFDPGRPEDAALYAHERHHQRESGGRDDGHDGHDAEEKQARAIERMVLHRALGGESLDSIMRALGSGERETPAAAVSGSSGGAAAKPDAERDAQAAYRALRASGLSHQQIVRQLRDYVVTTLMQMEEQQNFRSTEHDFF